MLLRGGDAVEERLVSKTGNITGPLLNLSKGVSPPKNITFPIHNLKCGNEGNINTSY